MDLIERTDVCEVLADMYPTDGETVISVKEIDKAYDKVRYLPSAQPEIIMCEDCIRYEADGFCGLHGIWMGVDDYCSRAERREE